MRIRTRIRVAAAAAFALSAGLASGGCGWSDAHTLAADTDPITAQRAQDVSLMLSNSYAAGPETQAGIMSVIAGYGGGYVTSATLTGSGAAQELTVQVVLGAGTVRDQMQGESDFGVSGTGCYSFILGYRGPRGAPNHHTCPQNLTDAAARAEAARQIGDQIASELYDMPVKQIPMTLQDARQVLFPTPKALRDAGIQPLDAEDFAAGTDATLHRPMSALALARQDGACEYVVFRWISASAAGSGTASTSINAFARAWVAPTQASCTGSAALAAGAFLTADRYAGG